jgi:hypothetical protein
MKKFLKESHYAHAKRMRKPHRHEKGHKKSKWRHFIDRYTAL